MSEGNRNIRFDEKKPVAILFANSTHTFFFYIYISFISESSLVLKFYKFCFFVYTSSPCPRSFGWTFFQFDFFFFYFFFLVFCSFVSNFYYFYSVLVGSFVLMPFVVVVVVVASSPCCLRTDRKKISKKKEEKNIYKNVLVSAAYCLFAIFRFYFISFNDSRK